MLSWSCMKKLQSSKELKKLLFDFILKGENAVKKHHDWSKEIPQLIEEGKIYRFYNSYDFRHKRAEVLRKFHYECQECRKYKRRITRATVVHHVLHVEDRPDLCLSEYYTDENGAKHIQLEPVCDACHNKLHPEKGRGLQRKESDGHFHNEERW